MLRLSSDWLLGGILSRALADTFKYFRLQGMTNKQQHMHLFFFLKVCADLCTAHCVTARIASKERTYPILSHLQSIWS